MQEIIVLCSIFLVGAILYYTFKKKAPLSQPGLEAQRKILQEEVAYYQELTPGEKLRFEEAVRNFLAKVKITGVKTKVEDIDMVFVAAAAIIPVFAFKGWEYRNINEVLLYPDSFSKEFQQSSHDRNVLGMVGEGSMQHMMILSRRELRDGFFNETDRSNTAIHEFVHLIDKMDGDTDGLPEVLMTHKYTLPWLQLIHEEIQHIRAGKSDIDPYGSTNKAEFFAVVAEYFFKQPERMEDEHPELFKMLKQIFEPK